METNNPESQHNPGPAHTPKTPPIYIQDVTSIPPLQGQGQGYITTNSQSVSMSWYRAQSRTIDQSLLSP
jgi:hypothetical protein